MILILLFISFALIAVSESTGGETFLTETDFQRGNELSEFPDGPIDLAPMFSFSEGIIEGDILPDNYQPAASGVSARKKRNVMRGDSHRWPNGRVPYTITTEFTQAERARLAKAMTIVMSNACIKFDPKTEQDLDYADISKPQAGDGVSCASSTGRRGGQQKIFLGPGCFRNGFILHELLHTLGFRHEHTRPDRDSYIQILTDNIAEGLEGQFKKQTVEEVDTIGRYDYHSIMHYPERVYGKIIQTGGSLWGRESMQTMKPLKEGIKMLGNTVGLSRGDKFRLKTIYKCPTDDTTATLAPSPDDDCIDMLVEECKSYAPVNCTWFVAQACQKTCGMCGEGSNPECMIEYVVSGGNPAACSKPQVMEKCADFCKSILNDAPQPMHSAIHNHAAN